MKCKKCGFTSFDYNQQCPSCGKELTAVRQDLGLYYSPPDVNSFDEFFTGSRAHIGTSKTNANQEAELDLENAEDFEFTLDD